MKPNCNCVALGIVNIAHDQGLMRIPNQTIGELFAETNTIPPSQTFWASLLKFSEMIISLAARDCLRTGNASTGTAGSGQLGGDQPAVQMVKWYFVDNV